LERAHAAFSLETKSQRGREKSKEHIWIGKVKKLQAGGRKKRKRVLPLRGGRETNFHAASLFSSVLLSEGKECFKKKLGKIHEDSIY